MRERNIEFINSIGELIEEIANQDLELVNGGEDNNRTIAVTQTVSLPCIPTIAPFGNCGNVTNVTLSKLCGGGEEFITTLDCRCKNNEKGK